MDSVYARVYREQEAFNAEVPTLMQTIPGKWVVYRGGVQGVYDDEDAAYADALARFGVEGGFVLDRVEPRRVITFMGPATPGVVP